MDNLTHTMVGWTLSKAGLERKSPLALPILLIGANLPDAEVVRNLFGGNYLESHRGISHAPVGILGLSFVLAGAFWLYERRRPATSGRRTKFWLLWGIALAGLATHPFLDYLNDYGIRPLLPFSSAKYYGDLLTLINPWVWLIFGCALFLLTQSRFGRIAWLTLGIVCAVVVCAGWSLFEGLLWIVSLAAALWLGRLAQRRRFNPGVVALATFLLFLGGVEWAHESVRRSAERLGPGLVPRRVEKISVLPGRPGSIRSWTVVMETAREYYIADVGLQDWGKRPPRFEEYDKNLDNTYYQLARQDPAVAVLIDFARFPAVTVESTHGSHTVILRDLRYARRRTEGWAVARATIPAN